jgi:formamidopyrimidine-DNA glycosylase
MPELPEVQIIVDFLKTQLIGKKIVTTKVFYEPVVKNTKEFQKIEQTIILDIQRKGKFLLFFLTQELILIGHLRMEGKLFIKPCNEPKQKYEHFKIIFEDKSSLRYYDFRKFGRFEVKNQKNFLTQTNLHKLALDPFEIHPTTLYKKILKTKSALKKVLLNQKIISGLGNIYVNEILFLVKLHPEIKSCELSLEQVQEIVKTSQKVLTKAIKWGGTTISTFESQPGIIGYFQNKLQVHNRINKPCINCQTKIIKIKVGGRGTYLCPVCQNHNSNK